MKIVRFLLILSILAICPIVLKAQCDDTRNVCSHDLAPYISDGQYRSANLKKGETKVYRSTFYGERYYKIVTGTNGELGNVRFKLISPFYKVLFDSKDYNYPHSWKLKFKNTSDFMIEVSLADDAPEGCTVMLIGFEI